MLDKVPPRSGASDSRDSVFRAMSVFSEAGRGLYYCGLIQPPSDEGNRKAKLAGSCQKRMNAGQPVRTLSTATIAEGKQPDFAHIM